METLWQDLRVGLRQLLTDKAFSIAAILTLTLGIGATAAMLTVLNAVLLRELPYKDAGQLVMLEGVFREKGDVKSWSLSELDVQDLRRRSTVFSGLSIFGKLAFNLEQGQQSRRLQGELVNDSYFPLLGLKPALGRLFNAEDDARPMEQYVVVLGYDLWRNTFGGDPGVLSRTLQLNDKPYKVIGVAPRGFRGLSDVADLWVPSMVPPVREFLTLRKLRWAEAAARLKPGVTPQQAGEQLASLAGTLAQDFPDSNRGIGVTVTPLKEFWLGKLRSGLVVLTLGAFIILLIGCINVSSLLLARAAAKQRAFGIRVALGASRQRLVRQLLTESVLLSLLGAVFGLLLAEWATGALLAFSGVQFQSFVRITMEPSVIVETVGIAVLCGLAFGLAPLGITFAADLTQSLTRNEKLSSRGKGWHRFQNAVVIAQVALALTLSVDAALMTKGFRKLVSQDLGFRPAQLLTFRIDLRGPKYVDDAADTALLRREYLRRIAAVPGVAELAMADPNIPSDDLAGGYMTIEDHPSNSPDGTYFAMMHAVTPAYFHVLGIPLEKGRAFTPDDTQSNAVIVSRALAEQQWPGQNPIGKRLKLDVRDKPGVPWLSVVGVAAEVRHEGIRGERAPAPDLYLSLLQFIRRPPLTVNFLVRPQPGVSTAQLRHALHQEMMAIDPEVPDYDVATLAERLARQTDKARFQVLLLGIFTGLALVLATVGIYGVIAYSVAQRTREIAIRVSLGADRASILRMVVGKGARLAAIGLALGLLAVFALRPLLADLLFETSLFDPLILCGTALALFLVTLAANYVPARRAAIVDPMTGLRLQ
jgi:putative ABC transport system permease protein